MSEKIAYVVSQFPKFSETFVQREVSEINRSDHDIQIYSLKTPEDIESEINIEDKNWLKHCNYSQLISITVVRSCLRALIVFRLSVLLAFLNTLWHLRKTPVEALKLIAVFPKSLHYAISLNQFNVDHIHAHWANTPSTIAFMLSRLMNDVTYSFTGHAWDIHSDNTNKDFLETKIKDAEVVVTCTGYNRNYLNSLDKGDTPVRRNYHGLIPEDYTSTREDTEQTYMLAGGRLVEKKGFDNLVKSLGKIKNGKGYEIPTVIFGDGPMEEELRSLKDQYNLTELTLVGRIDHSEVKEYLEDAQVFVAPSIIPEDGDIDGIPNVILEAFASSTPAIGSDMSGIPEVVIPGETGWLVDPDNIDQLATACNKAWKSPEDCAELGRNGRSKVDEDFDIRKNVKEYIEIIGEQY